MPSPIAHATAGYLVYRLTRRSLPATASKHFGPIPYLLTWTLAFAILPDIDSIAGLLSGDFGRYHNNGTHSLVVGLGVAALGAGFIWFKDRKDFLTWFLALWLSYASHVILDLFTIGGRGVMLLWPLSDQRFDSAIKLFYGVRWSQGVFSLEHLWTIGSELLLSLVIILVLAVLQRGSRPGVGRSEGRS
jgi:inner membrane protein